MGFLDKMKEQAGQLADKAQEAGKAGQAKIEAVQARRRADTLLRELGAIDYAARRGNPQSGGDARVNALVEQIRQYETEYGPIGDGTKSADD